MANEVRIRLVELLAEKSKRDRKLYNISDVAHATGIDRRRLYDIRDGKMKLIKPDEIKRLCDFFPCEVGELICYHSPLEPGQEYVSVPKLAFA